MVRTISKRSRICNGLRARGISACILGNRWSLSPAVQWQAKEEDAPGLGAGTAC